MWAAVSMYIWTIQFCLLIKICDGRTSSNSTCSIFFFLARKTLLKSCSPEEVIRGVLSRVTTRSTSSSMQSLKLHSHWTRFARQRWPASMLSQCYRHDLRSCSPSAIWAARPEFKYLNFGLVTVSHLPISDSALGSWRFQWIDQRAAYTSDAIIFVLNSHPFSQPTGAAGLPEPIPVTVGRMRDTDWNRSPNCRTRSGSQSASQ